MQYLRRSIAFFFALQQLKLDFATISSDEYKGIFFKMESHDPGLQVLFSRVVRAKNLLIPFLHYRDKVLRSVSDVDNVLSKHPLYSYSLTQTILVSLKDILGVTDRVVREDWTHEKREEEVHFMFSLLALVKYNKAVLDGSKAHPNFNLEFIEDEAFIVLREYGEDFGRDSVYVFYQLAFTPIPAEKKKH